MPPGRKRTGPRSPGRTSLSSASILVTSIFECGTNRVNGTGQECAKRSVKHPASVMIWGCICSRGTGRLCVFKTTVNSAAYLQVLEHQLLPSIEDLFGDEEVLFQHDLAPAHSVRCTTTWLRSHNILFWSSRPILQISILLRMSGTS